MSTVEDPFEVVVEETADDFEALARKPATPGGVPGAGTPAAATARLHGFDLDERPLLVGLPDMPFEVVAARTCVPLARQHLGATVVVLFEEGDVRRPIVVGLVLDGRSNVPGAAVRAPSVSAQVDDQRLVITAEREVVLRCGEASITLTRAGKVLIKGIYVLSRSKGHSKIKGAVVDIN